MMDARPPREPQEPKMMLTDEQKIKENDQEISRRIKEKDLSGVPNITCLDPEDARIIVEQLQKKGWPEEEKRWESQLPALRQLIRDRISPILEHIKQYHSSGCFLDDQTVEKMLEPLNIDRYHFRGAIFLHALRALSDDVAKIIGPIEADIMFRDLREPLSDEACEYLGAGIGNIHLSDLPSHTISDIGVKNLSRRKGVIACIDEKLAQRITEAKNSDVQLQSEVKEE